MDYLFYQPELLHGADTLSTEEAIHCVKVLRKKAGELITLTDGAGSFYTARLISASPSGCRFEVIEQTSLQKPKPDITIAVSPVKHADRFEWLIEKCTEAGAGTFIPILCERTQKSNIRIDRLKKISISAMKQSLRPWLPEIREPMQFDEILNQFPHSARLICTADGIAPVQWIKETQNTMKVVFVIGPEGDFTDEELQRARHAGFLSVNLGPNRLRTETAAVAATAIAAAFTA